MNSMRVTLGIPSSVWSRKKGFYRESLSASVFPGAVVNVWRPTSYEVRIHRLVKPSFIKYEARVKFDIYNI